MEKHAPSFVVSQDFIFKNNPYVDYRFNVGDFDLIYTDHERAYTDDVNVPLVEQILLRFGLTPEDLNKIDSRPSLYFDKDEKSAKAGLQAVG